MKTLSQIKDEVAREKGYNDFYTMQFPYDMVCEEDINEIAKRYAQSVADQALKDAAERAEVENCYGVFIVDKQSILETEIKLP